MAMALKILAGAGEFIVINLVCRLGFAAVV
jgi:predicted branched-subunit amino acid permease